MHTYWYAMLAAPWNILFIYVPVYIILKRETLHNWWNCLFSRYFSLFKKNIFSHFLCCNLGDFSSSLDNKPICVHITCKKGHTSYPCSWSRENILLLFLLLLFLLFLSGMDGWMRGKRNLLQGLPAQCSCCGHYCSSTRPGWGPFWIFSLLILSSSARVSVKLPTTVDMMLSNGNKFIMHQGRKE